VEITRSGGHLGFIGAAGVDTDRRWLDWRTVDWVLGHGKRKPAWHRPHASPRKPDAVPAAT
jgi:hypothetical protein